MSVGEIQLLAQTLTEDMFKITLDKLDMKWKVIKTKYINTYKVTTDKRIIIEISFCNGYYVS